ncbi:DNA mismatch repair protein MutS [Stagnihabitans tardus]|uniref:DNA mismatch repair protein MutS n=1 Tax=Stagnihabitans tardus TaxID=2699202 RepID=A0AAE5BTJ3_9RHOB|nr:DNA mismatch repair protein MutS [Stagnihabitans tardus]NBZ86781.1 DNA mismatch repair protein MutS [Stagnihabitans tardus]
MSDDVTPMMAQYLEIKGQHPGALLFYRMGDFYEMFFQDAVLASEALDIALTKRGTHQGAPIQMCGVPVHSAEGYLLALIRKGFRVAIAEQMEDPAEAKKRGYKAVVKRDVVRLVTPGTLTEDTLLEARRANYLCAFAEVREEGALAWADISTGEFRVMTCPGARLGAELARLGPREVLVSEAREATWREVVEEAGAQVTALGRGSFDSSGSEARVARLYGVAGLASFGAFTRAEVSAMGALVDYLELTQRGKLPLLRAPVREASGGTVQMDGATRRNLELTQALSGGREGSLLSVIDRTVTSAGARLLEARLGSPSRDVAVVRERLGRVAWVIEGDRHGLRDALRMVPDMDRALSRLALERGGPRDLAAVRAGLVGAARVAALVAGGPLFDEALLGHEELVGLLEAALVAEPPLLARDGGFVAEGFHAELDQTRRLRDEGRGVVGEMQAEFVAETGIGSLKIKHNNVLGYFIETTTTHEATMRGNPRFIHRQTTANQVRFSTVELSELETRILNAGNLALEIEKGIFERLRAAVLERAAQVAAAARALAEIDLAAGLAELAVSEDWVAPQIEESRAFVVEGGRHPVVEAALRRQGVAFVPNDCGLTQAGVPAIWLITGPNMGGKSTFLRQNALIALLAQMGSYVPARRAVIGVVGQIFSRVGAADDLARGRSTFMVEMVETAAILNQADESALVILDEIGRGTATWDGLSIAWAVLENLQAVNRCRALFATHYHELTALAGKLQGVRNATLAVREWEGEVVFLHEVKEGAADRSYGVQVARLAGLPMAVVERAKVVLEALEKGDRERPSKALIDDLPLFRAVAEAPKPVAKESQVEKRLKEVSADELSPREALALIYELKGLAG